MSKKKNTSQRTTQAEKHAATRASLLDHATVAFRELGYEAASTVHILEQAGMTRGALYYHFKDKRAIFEAVFELMSQEILQDIEKAVARSKSTEEALVKGSTAFLKAASHQDRVQIYLMDGPAVLGWLRWRELDTQYGYGSLREGVAAYCGQPNEALSLALSGAMNELALGLAQDKPAISLKQASRTIQQLIQSGISSK